MKISISASEEAIIEAEKQLGIHLPDALKAIWRASNGLEYPQDWRIYPVFDPDKPKKSWGHLVEENKRHSYDYIQEGLLKIASDSYGNHLILRVEGGIAHPMIYKWDHETTKLKKSAITLEKIHARALKRRDKILKKIEISMKKRKKRSNNGLELTG